MNRYLILFVALLLAGPAFGAEQNRPLPSRPATVSQTDAEAGTSTVVKSWPPARVKQAIDALGATAASLHLDDLLTAIGVASQATHLGTFTGSTIPDNQTVKAAIQALETAFEAVAGHDAVTLGDAATQAILGLTGQAITFDAQPANHFLAGPTTGDPAVPTFRALVAGDIPDISATYVPKSLFDAYTVLMATADNTPLALSVTEETVVGRVTGGAIAALTLGNAATNVFKLPADPAAHTILGFDNTDNIYKNFTIGTGLTYTQGTATLSVGDLSGTYQPLDATLTDIASKTITWDGDNVIFPGSVTTTAGDGSRKVVVVNNTAASPTAASDELYPEANIWKVNQNGTESSVVIGPTAGQVTISGTTQPRTKTVSDAAATIVEEGQATGGVILGDASPDVAGELGYATGQLIFHDGTSARNVAKAGTLTNTKWCSSDGTVVNCNEDAPAGTGDITAVGSCTSGDCSSIGNGATSGGYIRLAEDSDNGTNYTQIKGNDDAATAAGLTISGDAASTEDFTITLGANNDTITLGSTTGANTLNANAFTISANGFVPDAADGAALGSATAEFSDLYLAAGGIIYGENDQGNTLTSAATGWSANLLFTGNAGFAAKNGATGGGFIDFYEDSDNGTSKVTLKATDALSGDFTVTLPSETGTIVTKAQKFTQCITIKDPVATSDHQAWRAPVAITITNMHCLATGGTSLTGQFQEGDANGANMADIDSDMTCTAGSNVNDDGALSNGAIDAGDYIYWKTTSVSGTQTELIACFDYTYN